MPDATTQTYTAKASAYRADVISGKRIACKQIIALCKQIESDLADSDSDYYYDEAAAHLVCKIIECFRHIKGKLAASGQRIKLEPWQCNWICSLYGWKRKQDGLRRYRRATIILPRKQGKSLIAAALGIYHLIFDKDRHHPR
jgi:phage terminase large subunit-like protein